MLLWGLGDPIIPPAHVGANTARMRQGFGNPGERVAALPVLGALVPNSHPIRTAEGHVHGDAMNLPDLEPR